MNDIIQANQFDPIQIGNVFAQSGMFPDTRDAAQCATKLVIGQSLGLTAYDSMAGLHIVKSKVVLASNTMAAAIKRSGKYDYRAKTTEEACTITFYDVTGEEPHAIGSTTWTMADAKKAGLGGDNWRKYPKAMLFARCISAGYREHCPDALGAAPVYTEAHGETELGITVEENNAELAALPPSSLSTPPAGGASAPSLEVEEKPKPQIVKTAGASSSQPTKIEFDVSFEAKSGKVYEKHHVHLADGSDVQCFSNAKTTKLVREIEEAMDRGDTIEVTFDETKYGKDLTGYNLLDTQPEEVLDAPKPEPSEYDDSDLPF